MVSSSSSGTSGMFLWVVVGGFGCTHAAGVVSGQGVGKGVGQGELLRREAEKRRAAVLWSDCPYY